MKLIMQTMQQFCLRWNNHQPNFISVFTSLLSDKTLVDVTLACEGKHLQAHRVVLSACSAYFQTLFTINPCQHPIVILKDIRFSDLKTMVDFMYYGEVNVSQEQLPAILKIADMLKIKGLADMPTVSEPLLGEAPDKDNYGSPSPSSPAIRRKRLRKTSTGSGSGSTEQTSEEMVSEGVPAHSPLVKIEHVDDAPRSFSRQSLRNSHQDPSTDSEPKDGSQDLGNDDLKRQSSSESRQISYETHQMSIESVQGPCDIRQLSHESRQSSTEGRQVSYDSRQGSHDSKQLSPEVGKPHSTQETRQASYESRLSHDSSIESTATDPENNNSNLSATQGHVKVGSKRGRLLMRQPRIKKESDIHMSPDSEPGSPGFLSSNLLSVPPLKIERQRSDPTPTSQTHSPPPSQSSLNLLTVPQPMFSVRQQPSSFSPQSASTPAISSRSFFIQRQVSQTSSLKTEESTRSVSPSNLMESIPVVRIISESEQTNRLNSSTLRQRSEETKRTVNEIDTSRPVHCPVQRSGPALGCNFCWNTTDAHGRILRRKTKFHCPECQTNLCIVPCFQQYHHKQDTLTNKTDQQASGS